MRRFHVALVPGVIALALLGAGCGGDDDRKSGGTVQVSADADRFAGPVPLNVKFSAKPKSGAGKVHYRWRFDDGTQSEDQNPTHSFTRAGYYTVILDVRDESGNNTRQSLLLGAWPPKLWARAQTRPPTKDWAARIQRVQQKRTEARHRALGAEFRKQHETGS